MTLPLTGTISASMINLELGRAANAPFSLNDPAVRALAGKPTGAISFSDFRGKSSIVAPGTREPIEGHFYELDTYDWIRIQAYKSFFFHITWNGLKITGESDIAGNPIEYAAEDGWVYHLGNAVLHEVLNDHTDIYRHGVYRIKS